MKKLLLLLAVIPFILASCGGDDEEDNNQTEKETDIVGIWKETNPYDKSFISLANDGTYKLFASKNNSDVGFMLDAGYYSVNKNTIQFQSAIGKSYDYMFTLNNGNISLPLENGKTYTFQKEGRENNALTNTFIGKTYKCSEGGYMWVGGTDYGTVEFNNGYLLTYTVTTVKDKVTQKETKQTYNYLFFNNKFYIQQTLGFYICTYTIKNDVLTITDADGRKIFK